jgi:fucose 4-O-acetylase-like acetyltransferase
VSRRPYPFVDWTKAIGMTLIVYGHTTHVSTLAAPIYAKQFGVALFLFATGFTLAREKRAAGDVLFNRLFQTWMIALALALLITVSGALTGSGLALSNFLPLLGGANVVLDHFPANPTTWYLATYLHLLLLWALWLRRIRIRAWMVAAAVAIEIPIRAALIAAAGPFVAYMLLTNWASVFLFGIARGSRTSPEPERTWPQVTALVGGLAVWSAVAASLGFEPTIPFMTLRGWPAPAGLLVTSAAVSFLYLSAAALGFEATRRVTAPAPVRFIARNTPAIFLVHMPVVLALHPLLLAWGLSYPARVAVQLLVCLIGLSAVSEAIRALAGPARLSDRARQAWAARRPLAAPVAGQLRS